jgi:hypothetical protein
LLVLIRNGIGACVIGLRENVLVARNVLQIQRNLKCASLVFFSIRHPEIGTEVGVLLLAESEAFVKHCLASNLRSCKIQGREITAANGGNPQVETQEISISTHSILLAYQSVHHVLCVEGGVPFNVIAAFIF